MKIEASWIWTKRKDYLAYNQHIVARKRFRLEGVREARMAVTADTWYRLFINGEWVSDGPCRSWPHHYQYDLLDVTAYLREGQNEIRILGQYFGCGTMHQVPQQAGMLAQLDVLDNRGRHTVIGTDATWQAAEAGGWLSSTPRISVQMGPSEYYDGRTEGEEGFARAAVLFKAHEGPWQNLHPRDCPVWTHKAMDFRRCAGVSVVEPALRTWTFPMRRLLHPGLVESGNFFSSGGAVATHLVASRAGAVVLRSDLGVLRVNGSAGENDRFHLRKGPNFLLAAMKDCFGHSSFDMSVHLEMDKSVRLENPLQPGHENPWVFVDFMDDLFLGSDLVHPWFPDPDRDAYRGEYRASRDELALRVTDAASLRREMGERARCRPCAEMTMPNAHWDFKLRKVLGDGASLVDSPYALMSNSPEMTTIRPAQEGDVELVYDLGEETCGFWTFEILSDEDGVALDAFGVEYVDCTGRIQDTRDNHNGFRCILRGGVNRFTSLNRRAARYVYLTIRGAKKPVRIRYFRVIEATYPVERHGAFRCSDPVLEGVWDISERTLELCMEDTFTDCPLYEQTLWVGDARNESLFAYGVFGAEDITRRCIRLAGESLEYYPLVGCQVPSSWDVLLPAWSFLWGISVWDHYFHTGDRAFLRHAWPWVRRNLKNAEKLVDERGLFSGPYWNMFDWSGTDHRHRTVTHNSLFVVGAIDAALRCAEALKKDADLRWLREYRKRMVAVIGGLWDEARQAFPDSVHDDGTLSSSFSVHSDFLAVLYDVVEGKRLATAAKRTVDPPADMVPVGSPFAIQYLYEALEKLGRSDKILESIREAYGPMLRVGATTVWETFAHSDVARGGFPTRSHCHAWSSAPVYFLNRIVLGIVPCEAGGRTVKISPYVAGVDWAEGATQTIQGPVSVRWRRDGRDLVVSTSAPAGVSLRFERNDTHAGLSVLWNGVAV